MKKIILVIVLLFSFFICGGLYPKKDSFSGTRFSIVYEQSEGTTSFKIIRDNINRNDYLLVKEGYGAGLTFLH